MIKSLFETSFPKRAHASVCALLLLVLVFAFNPSIALADVRNDDIICGQTVEAKSLSASACPDVSADYAILVDGDGNVLFERGAFEAAKIASVTKVMTAIVAYEFNPEMDETITVTEDAAKIGESSAGLKTGDTMNLKTALKGLLVHSGNDASVSIAYSLGKKMLEADGESSSDEDACVARFVKAMNDKASEMNLKNTVFTNPHGLDFDEFSGDLHSCASDVAAEVAYLMDIEPLVEITSAAMDTITVNRGTSKVSIDLESTNELLSTYKGTVGVKTGFTELAGSCFAGAYSRKGKEYIAVVLHAPDNTSRFTDTANLWDWAKEHTVKYRLINCEDTVSATIGGNVADFPLVARVAHQDWPDTTIKATVVDFDQEVELFDMEGNVSQSVEFDEVGGNVKVGDKLGTLIFKQHNEEIARMDLVAAEDVDAPGIFEGIGIWWSRFTSGCTGVDPEVAQSVLLNETPLLLDKTTS